MHKFAPEIWNGDPRIKAYCNLLEFRAIKAANRVNAARGEAKRKFYTRQHRWVKWQWGKSEPSTRGAAASGTAGSPTKKKNSRGKRLRFTPDDCSHGGGVECTAPTSGW